MSNTAEITLDGKTFTFPVITGTEGEKAIDITKLRDETGYITLDTGYKNTGATKSAITFLDGELGVLKYRGYPIEQLAEKSTFIEVAFLLIYGELPTIKQLDAFSYEMSRHTLIHEDMKKFFDGGFALSQQELGLFGVGSMKCINQQLWMQFGCQSFCHITPGNNNAEMVG